MDECKPLLPGPVRPGETATATLEVGCLKRSDGKGALGDWQGLTLVHSSAQRKRLVWDRGCI